MVRERKCRASSKATEELVTQIAESGGLMAGRHNQNAAIAADNAKA